MQMQSPIGFVADIGGTNARFAIIDPETLALSLPTTYPSRDFASLPSAVAAYIATLPTRPRIGCIAVAEPITHQAVRLTNLGWSSTLPTHGRPQSARLSQRSAQATASLER